MEFNITDPSSFTTLIQPYGNSPAPYPPAGQYSTSTQYQSYQYPSTAAYNYPQTPYSQPPPQTQYGTQPPLTQYATGYGASQVPGYQYSQPVAAQTHPQQTGQFQPNVPQQTQGTVYQYSQAQSQFPDNSQYQQPQNYLNAPQTQPHTPQLQPQTQDSNQPQNINPQNHTAVDLEGLSITDPCISWAQTQDLLIKLSKRRG